MTGIDRHRRMFEELVRCYARDGYRFAYRLCGDREMADDVVQEAFCEAWKSIGSLRDPDRRKAWLFQIIRHRFAHAIRDQSRRLNARSGVDGLDQAASDAGPDVLERLANQEILQRALDGLPDRHKVPFLLVFLDGFTCQEAADLLEIPLGTVLSRIHRARQSLRQLVRQLSPTAESPSPAQPHSGHKAPSFRVEK